MTKREIIEDAKRIEQRCAALKREILKDRTRFLIDLPKHEPVFTLDQRARVQSNFDAQRESYAILEGARMRVESISRGKF